MKEILHDPEIQCDIFGAVRFYTARQPELGTRFVRAVDEAIAKVASRPEQFSFYEKPIRSCRVQGFPYRILFADEPQFVFYRRRFAPGPKAWMVAIPSGTLRSGHHEPSERGLGDPEVPEPRFRMAVPECERSIYRFAYNRQSRRLQASSRLLGREGRVWV